MKQITLKKKDARVLTIQLENKQDGYSVADLRKLDKFILNVLEKATEDYDKKIEELNKEMQSKLKELDTSDSNYQLKANQLNVEQGVKLNKVNDTIGEEEVKVEFEGDSFDVIKTFWETMSNVRASKDARKTILRIDDAIANVEGD